MAESASFAGFASRSDTTASLRHPAVIRITHWINALSFIALLVSGIAILLSHPRLYWGETGNVATPSLIDLPLPFVLANQNGWARYLHFQAAWLAVLNGLVYVLSGLLTRHFRKSLLPEWGEISWRSVVQSIVNHARIRRRSEEESLAYNVLERITYSIVIFILFPLAIWTGLAMSPAITSVFPTLVLILGGQQSARTIHFFVSCFLAMFLVIHIAMVCLAGFGTCMRPMITGYSAAKRTEV